MYEDWYEEEIARLEQRTDEIGRLFLELQKLVAEHMPDLWDSFTEQELREVLAD